MATKYVQISVKFTYPALVYVSETTARKLRQGHFRVGDPIYFREHENGEKQKAVIDSFAPRLLLKKM